MTSQMDHVIVSLKDALNAYTPPVEKHRYTVNFVPVVEQTATHQEIGEILSFDST